MLTVPLIQTRERSCLFRLGLYYTAGRRTRNAGNKKTGVLTHSGRKEKGLVPWMS